jgi:hypothetical protein
MQLRADSLSYFLLQQHYSKYSDDILASLQNIYYSTAAKESSPENLHEVA